MLIVKTLCYGQHVFTEEEIEHIEQSLIETRNEALAEAANIANSYCKERSIWIADDIRSLKTREGKT